MPFLSVAVLNWHDRNIDCLRRAMPSHCCPASTARQTGAGAAFGDAHAQPDVAQPRPGHA
jgi:hypothetical protein